MRKTYRILAHTIAVLVVVQAMSMVYALSGMLKWVDEGGVLNKAVMEDRDTSYFPEDVGFMIHGMSGQMLIPLVALILLIVSFFVKIAGATKVALAVVALVALQIVFGLFGPGVPVLGALHGLNAFLLLGAAIAASRLNKEAAMAPTAAAGAAAPERV